MRLARWRLRSDRSELRIFMGQDSTKGRRAPVPRKVGGTYGAPAPLSRFSADSDLDADGGLEERIPDVARNQRPAHGAAVRVELDNVGVPFAAAVVREEMRDDARHLHRRHVGFTPPHIRE